VVALVLAPVLIVVAVVASYVYASARRPAPQAHPAARSGPTAAPAVSPTPSLGTWQRIQRRSLDPSPLSAHELFPMQFSAHGLTGKQAISRGGTACRRAVIGTALRAAVRKAGCTQVVRASYVSANGKVMATIGVLNLRDARAANTTGRSAGAHGFVRQLPAAHGPAHRLGRGTGLEEADVMGHYLILTWAEFANLHSPAGKKQIAYLKDFSTALITGTANISLSHRMVTGQPSPGTA
jgi:hypothetical protein